MSNSEKGGGVLALQTITVPQGRGQTKSVYNHGHLAVKTEIPAKAEIRHARAGITIPSLTGERTFMEPKVAMMFGTTFFLFIAVVYVYIALALMTIATKTNTPNGWLAWIPIANIFLMFNIAGKPAWWFILFLIPLVNIVIAIIVWMAIAEARHKPNWWGILMIVPVVNLIVPGYLAWSD
ncbi:MAG TPA: DUF5684 domain-containing protein [Verrucomicrobiae bacterium]|nr:DUF5684 domain-containing protein [Verrucomicrobiae bacterium]